MAVENGSHVAAVSLRHSPIARRNRPTQHTRASKASPRHNVVSMSNQPTPTNDTGKLNVGDTVPDFDLIAGGFTNVKLSDYKGKKVVLAFFPNCFSGASDDGCQCQMEELKELTDADIPVIGISRDQPFAQKAWMDKIGNPALKTCCDWNMKVIEPCVGSFDFGAFFDGLGITKGFTGFVASNRGCLVLDEDAKIIYKWIALDDAGKSHPGFIPPMAEVKTALGL